jgi:hypothetical protein
MDAHRLQTKIFLEGAPPALEPFIPVFHEWIRQQRLKELLVDVANYIHVPKGPGVGIVGHESDYFIDQGDGRAGLLYSRKREAPAPEERVADAFRRAFHAALLLEQESAFGGKLRFRTDELLFRVNDRLHAPSGEASFASLRPELEAVCTKLFGERGFALKLASSPRQLLTVRITPKETVPLSKLLETLGGPPA